MSPASHAPDPMEDHRHDMTTPSETVRGQDWIATFDPEDRQAALKLPDNVRCPSARSSAG